MYFYTLEELIKYNLESFWKKSFNVIKLSFLQDFGTKEMLFSQFEAIQTCWTERSHLSLTVKTTLYNTQQMKVITITQILDSSREQVVKFHIIKRKVLLVLFKKIPV